MRRRRSHRRARQLSLHPRRNQAPRGNRPRPPPHARYTKIINRQAEIDARGRLARRQRALTGNWAHHRTPLPPKASRYIAIPDKRTDQNPRRPTTRAPSCREYAGRLTTIARPHAIWGVGAAVWGGAERTARGIGGPRCVWRVRCAVTPPKCAPSLSNFYTAPNSATREYL